jgi:hypothetical protein
MSISSDSDSDSEEDDDPKSVHSPPSLSDSSSSDGSTDSSTKAITPEIVAKFTPLLNPELEPASSTAMLQVLAHFDKTFSDKVHRKGAKVPPMDVKLKRNVEMPKALRCKARVMAREVDKEISDNLDKLALLDIIEEAKKCPAFFPGPNG